MPACEQLAAFGRLLVSLFCQGAGCRCAKPPRAPQPRWPSQAAVPLVAADQPRISVTEPCSRVLRCGVPRRYQGLREPLLGTTQLLYCLFLSSLQPLPPPAGATAALTATTCSASSSPELGSGSCSPGGPALGGGAVLAGFGILRFVVHSCGLHYLALAPLLLRVSTCAAICVHLRYRPAVPAAQSHGAGNCLHFQASAVIKALSLLCAPHSSSCGAVRSRVFRLTLSPPASPPAAAHAPRTASAVCLAVCGSVPPPQRI